MTPTIRIVNDLAKIFSKKNLPVLPCLLRSNTLSSTLFIMVMLTALCVQLFSCPVFSADHTWTGQGADANWTTAGNWSGGIPDGADRIIFDASSTANLGNLNNLGPGTLTGMQVQVINPAGDVLIAGDMMGLSTAVPAIDLSLATRDLAISVILVQDGNTVYNVGAGRTLSLLSSILGSGDLIKRGDGTITLSNANGYNGSTLIQGGTLAITGTGFLGGTKTVVLQDAQLLALNTINFVYHPADHDQIQFGSNSSANISVQTGRTLTIGYQLRIGNHAALSFGSPGNSGLTVLDPDSISYVSNSHTVSINYGTLRLNSALTTDNFFDRSAIGSAMVTTTVNAGATLDQNDQDELKIQALYGGGNIVTGTLAATDLLLGSGNFSGIISGAGHVEKRLSGTLILTGANTYSGGTTVSNGILQGTTTGLHGNIINNAAVVFDQDTDGTYAGNISGTGTLTKQGTGIVTLTGTNTFTGMTRVNAGTLAVTTSLGNAVTVNNGGTLDVTGSAGAVTVNSGGTLEGTGNTGTVTVNSGGTLAPGNSIGTINTSNLTFNAGSIYEVEVNSAGNSDLINVTGTVNLGNATLNVLAESGDYAETTDYQIITNDGADAVTGTFGTLNSNFAFLNPSVNYAGGDGNDVILTLVRNNASFNSVALTPNERAVAAALDRISPGAAGDIQTILTALTGLSAADACRAYDEMGGAGSAVFFETGILGMTRYLQTMSARLNARRANADMELVTFSPQPVYLAANTSDTASDMEPALFASGSANTPAPGRDWGLWIRNTGVWGSRGRDDVTSFYKYSLGGFTLGIDHRISDEFIAGLSAGYIHTRLDFERMADKGSSDSYKAALYGNYSAGSWYTDGILSYASNSYETDRVITVGGITRTAKGDFNGQELAAYIEEGYVLTCKKFFIRPMAAIQVTHIRMDDYTETGAGALNLAVKSRSVDSYLGSVGLRVSRPVKKSDNLFISPEVRMNWTHEFSNDDRAIKTSFAGVPGSSFVVAGDKPVRNNVILGLGINALFKESFNFYINYDVSLSRDYTDHALVCGLRYTWD